MDALIYSAMAGAERALKAQQVRANNLANAGTTGFRADMELAAHQAVAGFGYDARHMARLEADAVRTRSGTLTATGRELDAAIVGDGLFAVQFGDGEAYTRSGAFSLDAEGRLQLDGRAVLGEGGPIVLPPSTRYEIGADGSVLALAEGTQEMQAIDRLKLVQAEPGTLRKNDAGLLVTRAGGPLPVSEEVQVRGGHLEGSNVSPVEEMVATLQLNRDFEMQMKLFKAADEMAANGNRLLRE
ncbi:flagellar basal body rod protein FlgF [Pseudorhodoferax sp.]|uniref:flagellar basal body rod protein FlgF n=1 Tax=Pseudorhodoferax sp. TaxID=1993553 RepID=UPI002DD657EF|nr:flagellar basal body rod protein FlgF [Pseudorhodoferax sp.]